MSAEGTHNGSVFVILPDQLFPIETLKATFKPGDGTIFLAEDAGLFSRERFHQMKIVHNLLAIREYRDALEKAGYRVHHEKIDDEEKFFFSFEEKVFELTQSFVGSTEHKIQMFEAGDLGLGKRFAEFFEQKKIGCIVHPSPAFLTPLDISKKWLKSGPRKPNFSIFYENQRRRHGFLVDGSGQPIGGKWSFEADNRKTLASSVVPAAPTFIRPGPELSWAQTTVQHLFPTHPGAEHRFWIPYTRKDALAWFQQFLEKRFVNFGPYSEVFNQKSTFMYHSGISVLLNCGLLLPKEVIERAIQFGKERGVSTSSVEEWVRQISGWREFNRAYDAYYYDDLRSKNYWDNDRKFSSLWEDGNFGIPVLDHLLTQVRTLGYAHTVERGMVLANVMALCEVKPKEIFRWFMSHFVDASDWITAPCVYGVALASDGGMFSTKPMIAGSAFWSRMGDEPKGDWIEVLDGLFWRYLEKHRAKFLKSPSNSVLYSGIRRMEAKRRKHLLERAEEFLERATETT